MRPSLQALAATAFSRVGVGCGLTAERAPMRPLSWRRAAAPPAMHRTRTTSPQEFERYERYGNQEPERQDAAPVLAEDAELEASGRAQHGAAELLARPQQGGRGRDGQAPRRARARQGRPGRRFRAGRQG